MAEQDIPPPTITAMKIPIIRKGEYDIWSMRMRQYICHTYHNLWDVIINGDLEEEPAPTGETSAHPAPKTAKQLAAKTNQERGAIKSRFGGNEESKKMQKNVLKHQFENFSTALNESLDKDYGRFQKLISQLEVHGAPISKEDINQKFLRSLPPSWNQIALIMRNKPNIDEIDIDDLYNNLRVYKDEMKRSSSSTPTSQNLAFLSSENTSSSNEVSTASRDFRVSTARGTSQVPSTLCAHDVAYSFFTQPTTSPQLENEDFQQIDGDDLEELDLRWQVAISGRNQGRRSYGDNGRSNAPTNKSSSQALVAQDGLGGYDWSNDFEIEPVNYALMAISSSSLSSSYDNEGHELALESLESRILVHEKNELAWGEKYDQMSARDKTGLGYGTQLNEMSNNSETNSEISLSVFDVRSSDEESTPVNDMLSKADKYHAVPPPITGNFLTPRANISFAGLDEYSIRKKIIESKTTDLNTKTSETIGKTNEANIQKPKTVYEPVNRDKVIIEDWNSDDEDDVSEVQTVSPIKTNESQTVKPRVDKIDCNFHDKKSQEPKLKNVVNTDPRVNKLVWDNAKRVNHQKISNKLKYPHLRKTFVLLGVLTKTSLTIPVKQNEKRAVHIVSTARPVCTARPVSTVRSFAPKIAQTSGSIRLIYPRMDNVRPRGSYSSIKGSYYTKPAFRPKDLKQDVKNFGVQNMTTAGTRAVVNTGKGMMDTDLKKSGWVWRPKGNYLDHVSKYSGSFMLKKVEYVDPKGISKSDHAVVDSGCSSHMTGNKAYLSDYKDYNGGFVAFGSDPKGDEFKFNLFSVSQMCDKKNSVLFTETECLILSPSFKLLDESQVVLRAPRKGDVYSLDLKNIVPYRESLRVYNKRTKRVEENLHINFLEDQPNVTGTGPNWMFDLDFLTNSMNYIPVSVENQVNVDAGTQDSYVAGSSGKDKGPTQEYILLPLQPHRTRIPIEDVAPTAHEKPSESSPKDNVIQDSEDVIDKEGQPQMPEDEQVLHDKLEKMVTQELTAKAMDDVSRQAFEEEKRRIASQKKAAQATSTNKLSTDRSYVSTANTSYVSATRTSTGANAGESSFIYLRVKLPIDASTLPNADLLIDPNMRDLEDASDTLPNDGIFNGAYDDEGVGAVADFNSMDNTIALVAQGFREEEGIDYDEVFVPDARIEAIRMYSQKIPDDSMGENTFFLTQVKQQPEESFIIRINGVDVDVHVYMSMIGSLMYLTVSRPDIMFAVCACARFQVTPKASHDKCSSKRIFRYLKHQPKLGLWYPRDLPFELEAYSDIDYGGASLDRKSTTGGCQFLGRRLISWQCKKQTIVAKFYY
ncbi:hypothetical protein Tco_0707137 [Tanacetum coccineum]|uniref:Uncharacterized protein n=1 Tax=Tanacetum coccineum TaxID=301880 RepID=A0ABQ4YB02_9ASTR